MENKFSKEIQSDEESYDMSCPEVVAKHISQNLKNYNACVELCCAIGMLSIQLANVMDKIFAIDNKAYL